MTRKWIAFLAVATLFFKRRLVTFANMLAKIYFSCFVVVFVKSEVPGGQSVSSRTQDNLGNYVFKYDIVDPSGATNGRWEAGDAQGNKRGAYRLTDVDGRARVVEYVADGFGFRAGIKTNEPGTASSQPAGAVYDTPYTGPVPVGVNVAPLPNVPNVQVGAIPVGLNVNGKPIVPGPSPTFRLVPAFLTAIPDTSGGKVSTVPVAPNIVSQAFPNGPATNFGIVSPVFTIAGLRVVPAGPGIGLAAIPPPAPSANLAVAPSIPSIGSAAVPVVGSKAVHDVQVTPGLAAPVLNQPVFGGRTAPLSNSPAAAVNIVPAVPLPVEPVIGLKPAPSSKVKTVQKAP